jgi:hypothetical protein
MYKTWSGSGQATGPIASPQSGGVGAPGGWHPTILYLLALIVAEVLAVGFLSRSILR